LVAVPSRDNVAIIDTVAVLPETPLYPEPTRAEELAGAFPYSEPSPKFESRPREYHDVDFGDSKLLPRGVRLSNLILTGRGLELAQDAFDSGEETVIGKLESPAQIFSAESSEITPLWKIDSAEEGESGAIIELAFSTNGANWSKWFEVHSDRDSEGEITSFYPDGKPSPNNGYIPGEILNFGSDQYQYFRYRIWLYSQTNQSPVLSDFRIIY